MLPGADDARLRRAHYMTPDYAPADLVKVTRQDGGHHAVEHGMMRLDKYLAERHWHDLQREPQGRDEGDGWSMAKPVKGRYPVNEHRCRGGDLCAPLVAANRNCLYHAAGVTARHAIRKIRRLPTDLVAATSGGSCFRQVADKPAPAEVADGRPARWRNDPLSRRCPPPKEVYC